MMVKEFVRKLRRVRKAHDFQYTVQLPGDWAERMLSEGYSDVHIREGGAGSRELILTPLRPEDVKAWRLAQRRQRQRDAHRRRVGQPV